MEEKVPEFEKVLKSDKKYLKEAGGYIGRNVLKIKMKMRTTVPIAQIILLNKVEFLFKSCYSISQNQAIFVI